MAQKARILLVEDEAKWRDIVGRILKKENCELHEADTLKKAFGKFEKESFDVVIVDLSLIPYNAADRQGFEFLKRVAKEQSTKAIVLTGYGQTEDARKAFRDYAVMDFITKQNLDNEAFRKTIREAMRQAQETRRKLLLDKS